MRMEERLRRKASLSNVGCYNNIISGFVLTEEKPMVGDEGASRSVGSGTVSVSSNDVSGEGERWQPIKNSPRVRIPDRLTHGLDR